MALYAFDGTWNKAKRGSDPSPKNTNVARFTDAYERSGGTVRYCDGIGTRLGLLGKVVGGVFGLGELTRIDEVYDDLCRNWLAGDKVIDIVGFSRGAATVLDFSNHLIKYGIEDPATGHQVEARPRIRFIGLFDVVAAFGIANLGNTALNIGHHLKFPAGMVDYVFHALALDERRLPFLPTRVDGAYEVWFRGVHSDIGGGNTNLGLNDITLKWMCAKAMAAGLPMDPREIAALNPLPATAPKFGSPKLTLDIRIIAAVDRVHYSVGAVAGCAVPPSTCVIETEADEAVAKKVTTVEVLSDVALQRVEALYRVAAKIVADEGFTLGDIEEPLLDLIEHRIRLVQNDAQLAQATQGVARVVGQTVRNAQQRGFHVLQEFFLNEALFQCPRTFPLTD